MNKQILSINWIFKKNKELNFSYDSLKIVDQYLLEVRKTDLDKLSNEQFARIVVRAGAYVGETIKRNDKSKQWNWVNFENAQKINSKFYNEIVYISMQYHRVNYNNNLNAFFIFTIQEKLSFPLKPCYRCFQIK